MPTYVYACPDCGRREAWTRPVADRDKLPECSACGNLEMVRELAAPAINMAGHEAAGRKGTK